MVAAGGASMKRISKIPLSMQIMLALAAGVALAVLLPRPGTDELADTSVAAFGTVGQLWLSALQMTILPLVFALLANGIGGARGVGTGGGAIARRSIFVFAILYALAMTVALAANLLLLRVWPVSPGVTAAFAKVSGQAVAADVPATSDIILSIIPSNVFAALAAGAMLPLVTFAILFGLAMRRIEALPKERLSDVIGAVADVMFRILTWALKLAPLGIFALILATAHSTGTDILSAMASYLRHIVSVSLLILILSYAVAWLWGRKSIAHFARAALPSQLVAFSTRSSVASLPVMLQSAKRLDVPDHVAEVSFPLAVAVFRASGPASTFSIAFFAAAASGIDPGPALILSALAVALLMEFAAVGLPNQVNIIAISAPVFALLGAPLAVLPLMLAVDPIADSVGTTANVSMDVAASTVIARGGAGEPERDVEAQGHIAA